MRALGRSIRFSPFSAEMEAALARYMGNATGRTLAETIETGTRHLSGKDMPKAITPTRGNRFSPRPAAKTGSNPERPDATPASTEEQD